MDFLFLRKSVFFFYYWCHFFGGFSFWGELSEGDNTQSSIKLKLMGALRKKLGIRGYSSDVRRHSLSHQKFSYFFPSAGPTWVLVGQHPKLSDFSSFFWISCRRVPHSPSPTSPIAFRTISKFHTTCHGTSRRRWSPSSLEHLHMKQQFI